MTDAASEFTFTPLGVGDAFSANHYSSCLLIEGSGTRLLVDCPHPIRKMLREGTDGRVDVGDIDAVVLTHLHADHCSGLEGLGYFSRFVLGRRAVLYALPAVSDGLWGESLRAGMGRLVDDEGAAHAMTLPDYFDLRPLSTKSAIDVAGLRVECRPTRHHIPTTALRIHAGDTCLGYSADTGFDSSLIGWLDEADAFLHETGHGIHTPYAKLAALPEATRQKMWLIHYPDDLPEEANAIERLRQGERYVVAKRGAASELRQGEKR